MKSIRRVYAWAQRQQARRGVRYAMTALVVVACVTLFGMLVATTASLSSQRAALVQAMQGENLSEGTPVAVELAQAGTITIDGAVYGGPRFAAAPQLIFAQDGTIQNAGAIAEAMLRDKRPDWIPAWMLERVGTTWMLGVLMLAFLLLVVWLGLTVPFLMTLTIVGIVAFLGRGSMLWAVAGTGMLFFAFILLMRAFLLAYRRPNQVLSVAHTVLKEAMRTRIPLVFIAVILALLPLIPLFLDEADPLRFRIQTFIARSMGFTFYLAAVMTLFLSCASVAFEIRDRQIWQLMTKPVSRLSYLIGKWLGVMTVNFVIMAIAAISVFTFVQFLREQPVAAGMRGYADAQSVRDEVLTARAARAPDYQQLTNEQIYTRIDDIIRRTPEYAAFGDEVPIAVRAELRKRVIEEHDVRLRSVPPSSGERFGVMEYTFSGLESAKELGRPLSLRYRFHILRDDEHETFKAMFVVNRDQNLSFEQTFVPTQSHVFKLSPEWIQDDGTIQIAIINGAQAQMRDGNVYGSINFDPDDFEILYAVGGFEENFIRAVVLDWIKLSFLAMLGICCATFLSFPVACLMSFTIFIAGTMGPFLAQSLTEYYPPPVDRVDWGNVGLVLQWAFQSVIRALATAIVFVLDAFGEYRPTERLVDGRIIPWAWVLQGAFWLGIVWSGIALLLGYFTLRKRQLAIYSGHG